MAEPSWDDLPDAEPSWDSLPDAPVAEPLSTKFRRFFDPGYGKDPTKQGLRQVVQQGLKAGAFLTGGTGLPALAASGGLYGLGTTEADTVGGAVKDAAKDAALTAVGGKALGFVGNKLARATTWPVEQGVALRRTFAGLTDPTRAAAATAAKDATVLTTEPAVDRLTKLVTGPITPSPSAQVLLKNKVRLTRGQQDPASAANQLEQALQSTSPHGTDIMASRAVPQADVQIAALNLARPPGMPEIPITTEKAAATKAVKDAFTAAYGKITGIPVYPAVHGPGGGALQGTTKTPGLVEQAVDSVARLSAGQRRRVKADVLDMLTRIGVRRGAVSQVEAGDIIGIRSIVRDRAREAAAAHDVESSALRDAYKAVEDTLTASLESQLPARTAKALKQIDAQYRNFMVVQGGDIAAAASPTGFSGRQLTRAATKGLSGAQAATGQGGPLQELGMAAADVFRTTSHPTAERLITLQTARRALGPAMPDWIANRILGGAVSRGNRLATSAMPVEVPARALPLPPLSAPDVRGFLPPAPASVYGAGMPVATDWASALAEALGRWRLRPQSAFGEQEGAP